MENQLNNTPTPNTGNTPNTPVTPAPVAETPQAMQQPVEVQQPGMPQMANNNVQPGMQPMQQPQQPANPNGPKPPVDGKAILDKIKGLGKGPLIGAAVLVVLVIALVIFKTITSSPKSVFTNTVEGAFKTISNVNKELEGFDKTYDIKKKNIKAGFELELSSNIESFKNAEIDKLSLGFTSVVNMQKPQANTTVFAKFDKEEISAKTYSFKDKSFIESDLLDGIVEITNEELGVDLSDYETMLDTLEENEIDFKTNKRVIDTLEKAIVKALDSKEMEKEKVKVDVAGKEIKATKNSYKFDDKALSNFMESIIESLLDDKNFVSDIADITKLDKKDIKESLKEMKKDAKDIEYKGKVLLNIYSRGFLNKPMGVSIEVKGDEYVTLLGTKDGFILEFDNHAESEYTKSVMQLEGKKEKKGMEITLEINKEEVLEINLEECSDKKIKGDIKFKEEDMKIEFDIEPMTKNYNYNGKFTVKLVENKEEITVKGKYTLEPTDEIKEPNTKDTIKVEDVDYDKIIEKLEEKAENEKIFKDVIDEVETAKKENLDLDSVNMIRTNSKNFNDVIKRTKPTVLYVGEIYYSSYDPLKAGVTLNSLEDLQKELKFNAYRLEPYYATGSIETTINALPLTCKAENPNGDTPCHKYPLIILIKDGKVQKVLQGSIEKETLKKELNDLGIK